VANLFTKRKKSTRSFFQGSAKKAAVRLTTSPRGLLQLMPWCKKPHRNPKRVYARYTGLSFITVYEHLVCCVYKIHRLFSWKKSTKPALRVQQLKALYLWQKSIIFILRRTVWKFMLCDKTLLLQQKIRVICIEIHFDLTLQKSERVFRMRLKVRFRRAC